MFSQTRPEAQGPRSSDACSADELGGGGDPAAHKPLCVPVATHGGGRETALCPFFPPCLQALREGNHGRPDRTGNRRIRRQWHRPNPGLRERSQVATPRGSCAGQPTGVWHLTQMCVWRQKRGFWILDLGNSLGGGGKGDASFLLGILLYPIQR